jgi:hypothetical protein
MTKEQKQKIGDIVWGAAIGVFIAALLWAAANTFQNLFN